MGISNLFKGAQIKTVRKGFYGIYCLYYRFGKLCHDDELMEMCRKMGRHVKQMETTKLEGEYEKLSYDIETRVQMKPENVRMAFDKKLQFLKTQARTMRINPMRLFKRTGLTDQDIEEFDKDLSESESK